MIQWSAVRPSRERARGRGLGERRVVDASRPLLPAEEAARMLRVPSTWLLAQARAGAVPHHRLGRYVRFDGDELRAWLAGRAIPARRVGTR